MYLYKEKQRKCRKRVYDSKVNTEKIDKRKLNCVYKDDLTVVYAGKVYSVLRKQVVMAAFVFYGDKIKPEIIVCTDTDMDAMTMCRYYGLRFQIEFLIRDTKLFSGLEDCQARDKAKLDMHFNISLSVVSIAKAAYYLSIPKRERTSFSMADIKCCI